ncbi:MAG TPA: MBOAT family O-acyltransferase [Solirubrobacterales bacterium]|nr:MBOAT family O-acyltransferase [Solirubrobacterales bacterium]
MLFNSYAFLFGFLPPVLAGWWGLTRWKQLRLAFLTCASWFFYAWWDWRYLPVLIGATSIDFLAGRWIAASENEPRRRLLLTVSLATNLGILAYFKYAGFFLNSLNGIGSAVGYRVGLPGLNILLPVGISFYTFNSMSYTIDIFRRRVEPTRNVLEYTTFVALFPHLIAGPIVRFTDLAGQLRNLTPTLTSETASRGLFFLSCGLVKKLLIADRLNPYVSNLYTAHSRLGLLTGWAAAVGYSLQLYFDFSGYSDMAVGLAYLLGFRFPQNFNSPFKAVNISDFWRRWHMSLSSWFRDYLFIPLGGSQRGPKRTVLNLVLTMFLAGLWHGAAWTFVVWGLVHGLFLGSHAVLRRAGWTPRRTVVNRALTFLLVCAAFVIFRSPSLPVAGDVLSSMFGLNGLGSTAALRALLPMRFALLIAALLVFVNVAPNTWQIKLQPRVWQGLALGLAAAVAVMTISQPHPFIYFQF